MVRSFSYTRANTEGRSTHSNLRQHNRRGGMGRPGQWLGRRRGLGEGGRVPREAQDWQAQTVSCDKANNLTSLAWVRLAEPSASCGAWDSWWDSFSANWASSSRMTNASSFRLACRCAQQYTPASRHGTATCMLHYNGIQEVQQRSTRNAYSSAACPRQYTTHPLLMKVERH